MKVIKEEKRFYMQARIIGWLILIFVLAKMSASNANE